MNRIDRTKESPPKFGGEQSPSGKFGGILNSAGFDSAISESMRCTRELLDIYWSESRKLQILQNTVRGV